MKQFYAFFICVSLFLSILSCKTLEKVDVAGIAGRIPTESVTTAVSGGVDFKSGEVLCARYDRSMTDNTYNVAKILTQASPATKNQAQALFLDGKENWTSYVIPSHKASKSELQLSKYVLFHSYAMHEEISQEDYRKANWYLGRITSTDELFKDIIEIKGHKYRVKWIRIPETVVK
jgi:hypothetical protein